MIKTSDEGTSYCSLCETWAKEASDLRQLLAKERDAFGRRETELLKENAELKEELKRVYKKLSANYVLELEAVADAAEDVATANGFVEGTATYASLPPWIIARVKDLAEALKALREGKPQ